MSYPLIEASVTGAPHDPVAAYDMVAPIYAQLAERRIAYLDRIDELVISLVPPGSRSFLDVGSGDGRRGRRIAQARNFERVVLVEPSKGMQKSAGSPTGFRTMRAEELDCLHETFDVVTCLWNVLGHIPTKVSRVKVMRQFGRLVSYQGRILVDVSHRYNAKHYGVAITAARFLYDALCPSEMNGDVEAAWRIGETQCRAKGHVFTDREFRALALDSGLIVEKRLVVDYANGRLRKASVLGHLFYVLRRA